MIRPVRNVRALYDTDAYMTPAYYPVEVAVKNGAIASCVVQYPPSD